MLDVFILHCHSHGKTDFSVTRKQATCKARQGPYTMKETERRTDNHQVEILLENIYMKRVGLNDEDVLHRTKCKREIKKHSGDGRRWEKSEKKNKSYRIALPCRAL